MKKRLCLLLALLLVLAMAGCKANEAQEQPEPIENNELPAAVAEVAKPAGEYLDIPAKPDPDDTFAATYLITRIETVSGEGSADEATMQAIRDRGFRTIIVLEDDGNGVMDLRGELTRFTYDDESGIITMNDQTSQMTLLSDGSLVIVDPAGTMYLELMP